MAVDIAGNISSGEALINKIKYFGTDDWAGMLYESAKTTADNLVSAQYGLPALPSLKTITDGFGNAANNAKDSINIPETLLPIPPDIANLEKRVAPEITSSNNSFNEAMPNAPIYQGTNFIYNELQTKWLADELIPAIKSLMNTTGFETVETDMLDEQLEFSLYKLQQDQDTLISNFASRGYTKPCSALDKGLNDLDEKFDNDRIKKNREILLTQKDIAKKNVQQAILLGIQVEKILMMYYLEFLGRYFESLKQQVNMDIEKFKTETLSYSTQINGNAAQIKGAVDIEKSRIELYAAKAEVATTSLDAYRQNLDAQITVYQGKLKAYETTLMNKQTQANISLANISMQYETDLAFDKANLELRIADAFAGLGFTAINTGVAGIQSSIAAKNLAGTLNALSVSLRTHVNDQGYINYKIK